jgi:hypothetical protein
MDLRLATLKSVSFYLPHSFNTESMQKVYPNYRWDIIRYVNTETCSNNFNIHGNQHYLIVYMRNTYWYNNAKMPVPVAARSKEYVYGRSPTAIVFSNPTGGMDVCLLCVLSGRGLCDELITRPEESYQMWCIVGCDQETSWYEEAIARAGLQSRRK